MRIRTAEWTIAATLAGVSTASSLEAQDGEAVLTIAAHVTDHANVAPSMLAEAQAKATAVYRAVGVELIWSSLP